MKRVVIESSPGTNSDDLDCLQLCLQSSHCESFFDVWVGE